MPTKPKMISQFIAVSCTCACLSVAQPSGDVPSLSFSLEGGYGLPVGVWKDHRYATVDQFGGGFTGRFEIDGKPWDAFGIALQVEYMHLGTGDWESYSRARGDNVRSSARVVRVGVLLKPYLMRTLPDVLKLEFGVGNAFASGHETFRGFSYDYDFLKGGFVFIGGVQYDRYFTAKYAAVVRACTIVGEGLEYADGEGRLMIVIPVTVGFRIAF